MPSTLRRIDVRTLRPSIVAIAFMAVSLVAATAAAAILERSLSIPHASAVYLLAVVAVGSVGGTWPAIATSVIAFLVYDFLFVRPLYTFTVAAPTEWLNLLLFLIVAIVIGRLTALQLERAQEAERRAAEARAMFAMSRDLATLTSTGEAAPLVVDRLAREAAMARVWLSLGRSAGEERPVADTGAGSARPTAGTRWVLRSVGAEEQPGWMRVHESGVARSRDREPASFDLFRIPIDAGGEPIGSIWATRARGDPLPGRSATRLLAAAADQLGQAVRRDRLAAEATATEVAREGDAMKTALLDSVSHDLRTPLAAIRAAAGNLLDPTTSRTVEEERELARSIDAEAERLNELVRNLLDLSRIEAAALRPAAELYELSDLVEHVVDRLSGLAGLGHVDVEVPPDLPPVRVDALFVDQIVANLLENAARHAPGAPVMVSARRCEPGTAPAGSTSSCVELVVEDGGPGVPASALPRVFDRFYRASRRPVDRATARGGMGVGLAVVKGLSEALGGSVEAGRSAMGGLAIVVRLPSLPSPAGPDESPAGEAAAGVGGVRTEP